jgi:TPR repeat protein
VAKDEVETLRWYQKAAEQGNSSAQPNLGFFYEKGSGVPQSDEQALKWYRKSAAQGNAQAQKNLSILGWQ